MNDLTQEQLWTLRGMVQKVGWLAFWNHIGSLMAEQADKVVVGSGQHSALANMASFMHLSPVGNMVKGCGTFDYLSCSLTPEEYKEYIRKQL